ncbi:MAG: polysaccharide deacetylase family protein [Thermotaleaceae bacterium]
MRIIILKKKQLVYFFIIGTILILALLFAGNKKISVFQTSSIREPIRNGDPATKKMAITCNVDWGNEVIPEMLNILDKEEIKITFFVTGRWASEYPELLLEIYKRGHEIGNHGYNHKVHSKMNQQENYLEIKKTEESIEKALGIKPRYFAPPSGDYGKETLAAAQALGYQTILWSIDTIDWKEGSTSEVILNRVMKKSHAGAILLMHPKSETVKALPRIFVCIQAEGITLGTISYLLE